jgi:predicted ribosome quality control (RQC) complex YloA/Tae2 family protein
VFLLPFDGIVVKNVVAELSNKLIEGRIEKIFQPEADEIVLNIRAKGQNLKLVMSANANYPRIHVTEISKDNPAVPPAFCMLLRKHISGGKIMSVEFHDYERIVTIHVESINELGDIATKSLIIEIMGKHSNIILTNSEGKIIDSIKHVDNEISSVREVMPARQYVLPPSQNKTSPDILDVDLLINQAVKNSASTSISVEKYLLNSIKGFSPMLCREVCFRARIESKTPISELLPDIFERLGKSLNEMISGIKAGSFTPCIVYCDEFCDTPLDFHCVEMRQYGNVEYAHSISKILDLFYWRKDSSERMKQKKSDLLKVLNNSLDRCNKKLCLQQEKLREVADRDKLQLYGELITANIYRLSSGLKSASLMNYYNENGGFVEVPLDENLSPQENAQRYFKQYTKAKSAFKFTSRQVEETVKELDYLESVMQLLENCNTVQEIDEVRQELIEQGYMSSKRKRLSKKNTKESEPMHFKSTDGLEIFVGKNNKQNDLLTLKTAKSNDMWLHTRNIPGSHVIIRKLQYPIPDDTLLEAAVLAAYYSKAKLSSNVPVDYTTVKNVKKPAGAKPGMVIYDNFKTIIVTPDESTVKKIVRLD